MDYYYQFLLSKEYSQPQKFTATTVIKSLDWKALGSQPAGPDKYIPKRTPLCVNPGGRMCMYLSSQRLTLLAGLYPDRYLGWKRPRGRSHNSWLKCAYIWFMQEVLVMERIFVKWLDERDPKTLRQTLWVAKRSKECSLYDIIYLKLILSDLPISFYSNLA